MENTSKVKANKNKSEIELGMVLEKDETYEIASMACSIAKNVLSVEKRIINKSEVSEGKVKSFYHIKILNQETKNVETAVMLH